MWRWGIRIFFCLPMRGKEIFCQIEVLYWWKLFLVHQVWLRQTVQNGDSWIAAWFFSRSIKWVICIFVDKRPGVRSLLCADALLYKRKGQLVLHRLPWGHFEQMAETLMEGRSIVCPTLLLETWRFTRLGRSSSTYILVLQQLRLTGTKNLRSIPHVTMPGVFELWSTE